MIPDRRMRSAWTLAVALSLIVGVAATAIAQRSYYGIRRPGPDTFNGAFTFCRLAVTAARNGDGGSWTADYPRADINLSIRLSELTRTRVNFDASGHPNHVVVRATEPALFQCPFLALSNPGRAFFDNEEAIALRAYLEKGGFLWADDFWGSYAWNHWLRELRKVLPADRYPLVDLPIDHPIFQTFFNPKRLPQIPNIGFYHGTGGETSERGADSITPRAGGLLDPFGRVLVLITHNTDFGDAFEREGEDPEFFQRFSIEGYAIGIGVLIYAMTH